MDVKMTRTFHPVGQGAFYSEEFCQGDRVIFRVVYDCGCRHGKANQQHGEAVVKDWMGKWNGDTRFDIDYLFISHFDFDHVSLLKVFANGGARIGRVILPLLNDGEKEFLTDLYCNVHARKSSGFLQSLIEKPEETLRAKVVRVKPVKDAKSLSREDFKEEDTSDVRVPSGTRFPVVGAGVDFDWRYIPCNYDDDSRGEALRKAMKNKFGNAFDPCELKAFSSLMKHWGRGKKKAFRKLKEVYCAVDGNINENSMTVYSGPIGQPDGCAVERSYLERRCGGVRCDPERGLHCAAFPLPETSGGVSLSPACVYTGDTDMSAADVRSWYEGCWGNVGTIQVPHHGSRLSFALAPFTECPKRYYCPISCSDKNYYKHPHACVTNALTWVGDFPIRVTETQEFTQVLSIC